MAKYPPNPNYFTYQEYDAVKKSLVYEPKETIDVSFANHLINSIHNTPKKEEKLRETFCELKKLVQRHHCFYEPGPETCCNYINYWLNKTVRDSKYGINKDNFKYFDEFMKIDPKIKENSTYCISKLSYMDNETFEKMKKLYDLYDYFTELKESKNRSSLCHNISKLSEKYESIWQECKGKDDYLCNKLRNLKRNKIRQKMYKYQYKVETLEKHIPDLPFQFLHHKHMFLYHKEKDWKNQRGERVNEHYQYPKNNLHDHYHYYH
ncbi:hypothetical protein PVNG_06309 [Plasmodium vivax North Korean]|uniref:Uncharacterized protein n=1 Tax=Plasmodium vivax North Korean TaxID=1035514 RepID=A0A0J9U0W4_PLAVI|nr:hypothetical protein PVNG_06309 [Plasmodium vivax North Korean]